MSFAYKPLFEAVEQTLLAYGSRRRPLKEIREGLDAFKTYENRQFSDDEYYWKMTAVVFYSGFRAATVTARIKAIQRHFPDYRTVSRYAQAQIEKILADDEMIRHEKKIVACVQNARLFVEIIGQHGSFQRYIDSFRPTESFENVMRLKEVFAARFHFLGGVTVYHFLTNIGLPVLKPDRVICRIFHRLGLVASEKDLFETVLQGRKFAEATGLPIRYIDRVFVAYGQVQTPEFGIDQGICLKEPRCQACGITAHCKFFQANRNL